MTIMVSHQGVPHILQQICANANNSGINLDLNKIRLSYLHHNLQYSVWIEFESEKLELLCWYLEKMQSQYEAHCHDHDIANTT